MQLPQGFASPPPPWRHHVPLTLPPQEANNEKQYSSTKQKKADIAIFKLVFWPIHASFSDEVQTNNIYYYLPAACPESARACRWEGAGPPRPGRGRGRPVGSALPCNEDAFSGDTARGRIHRHGPRAGQRAGSREGRSGAKGLDGSPGRAGCIVDTVLGCVPWEKGAQGSLREPRPRLFR